MTDQQIQIADIFLNEDFWRGSEFSQDTAPLSWDFVEDGAADIDYDSIMWMRSLVHNKDYFYVNTTFQADTCLSAWGVKREYKDVFILALNMFDIQWDDCRYIDGEDYDNYIQDERAEEEEE